MNLSSTWKNCLQPPAFPFPLPASTTNFKASNFKVSWKNVQPSCFLQIALNKPRNFVRLQPLQRERLEIAGASLILWPDIERSCGNQPKGIVSFWGWNNIVPPYFHTFPVFIRNHLAPPIFYTFDIVSYHLDSRLLQYMNIAPHMFHTFEIFNLPWTDSSW